MPHHLSITVVDVVVADVVAKVSFCVKLNAVTAEA